MSNCKMIFLLSLLEIRNLKNKLQIKIKILRDLRKRKDNHKLYKLQNK